MSDDIIEGVSAYLRADVTLQAIMGVSSFGTAPVYVGKAPQGLAIPYIVLRRIAQPPHHHAEGVAAIGSPTIQANVVAASSVQLQRIVEAVEARLDGQRGTFGTSDVRGAFVVGRYDDVVQTDDASDELPHEAVLDLEVWHQRTP